MRKKNSEQDAYPSLSAAEWEVMKPIWQAGPLPARDVYAALPPGHGWAYKTVKTLLSRLVAKGALEYTEVGNTYVYRAVYSRDQLARREFKGFLNRVLDGSLSPLVAHFIESENLSNDEIRELKELLEQKVRDKEARRRGRSDR